MFDAQREAQHVGINARSDQFAFVELGVRRRSGVYQETPGVAHVGQVADDLQVVEQRGSLLGRPFDAVSTPPKPLVRYFLAKSWKGLLFKPG